MDIANHVIKDGGLVTFRSRIPDGFHIQEFMDMSMEMITELSLMGFGEYELYSISISSFELV